MGSKVSTCLYIDKEVLENAKRFGLNISKVSENALKEAIGRVSSLEWKTGLNSPLRAVSLTNEILTF